MKVELKDLEEGDEIILSGCDLYYARVLRKPMLNSNGKTSWYTGGPYYKSVKLLISREEHTTPNGYKYHTITVNPDNVNSQVYRNLNGKSIWLVKRNGEKV